MPSDRESMFWLNVLEVPPKASANQSSQNAVQIAFRSRIKLFYRPAGIPISSEGVATKLSFTLVPKGEGRVLRVANPTPFNVTFQTLAIAQSHTAQGVTIKLGADDMVGPKSSVDSAPVGNNALAKNMSVFFTIMMILAHPLKGSSHYNKSVIVLPGGSQYSGFPQEPNDFFVLHVRDSPVPRYWQNSQPVSRRRGCRWLRTY